MPEQPNGTQFVIDRTGWSRDAAITYVEGMTKIYNTNLWLSLLPLLLSPIAGGAAGYFGTPEDAKLEWVAIGAAVGLAVGGVGTYVSRKKYMSDRKEDLGF